VLEYFIMDDDARLYGDNCGPATVAANTPEHAVEIAKSEAWRFSRGVTAALNPRVWTFSYDDRGYMARHRGWS
jgi:hypothetical protein